MRVAFLADKNRGVQCLRALLESDHDVVTVVGPPGSADWYDPPADIAEDEGIPAYRPEDVNDPDAVDAIASHEPDVLAMAGYSQILGPDVLDIPDHGVINLHGGKLPEYRGGSTLNWMILNGETDGGIAVLYADEDIDTGDIILQETFEIGLTDTIADVVERVDSMFPPMLVEALDRIEAGTADPTPQSRTEGAYYHSRVPRDGEIHWHQQTAKEVYDLVRSLVEPYPGAFTTYEGEKLIIWDATLLDEEFRGVPGRVARRRGDGVVVVAADRGLLLETVEYADGDKRPAGEFFTGLGVDLGR